MSAVDHPVEKASPVPEAGAIAEAPRRSLFFRFFRETRKSLESDGLVGRVTEHFLYTTLADLRMVILLLCQLLWSIEPYIAKYMASPLDRMMLKSFNVPLPDGDLAQILSSDVVVELRLYLVLWFLLEFVVIRLVYGVLEKFTLEEYEVAEREYKEAQRQLGNVEEDNDGQKASLLAPLVNTSIFGWLTNAIFGFAVLTMLQDGYGVAQKVAQEAADYAPLATPEELSGINPWRDLLPSQEGVLRERK
jgi:hypothetical protein